MTRQPSTFLRLLFKNAACLLFVSVLGNAFQASAQQYNLQEFSDGLAQPYVYTIVQGNKGYLWIGTGNGLSRFDGINFKTFTTKDSLADNFITCSFKSENDLWFGHMNGTVSYYDGKFFKALRSNHQISGITDIEKSPKGDVWASSSANGLIMLNGTTNIFQSTGENNQIPINTFQFLNENEILAGSVEGLNYCNLDKSGQVKLIRHINEIPDSKIQDIIKMKSGKGFYIATENEGIFLLLADGKQFKVSKPDLGKYNSISGIQSIYEDSKSNLWISTFGSGLIKLKLSPSGKLIESSSFGTLNGFSTNNVKTVYEDREGCIWSGNYGTGLTQITEKSFSMYSFDKKLYGSEIYSIYIHNNYRWLGTEKGLLKLNHSTGEILNFYSTKQGLPADKITALFSNQDNEIWIGTQNNGLYRFTTDNDKMLPVKPGSGILENSITAIAGYKKQFWIGTKKGACNLSPDSGKIRWYTMENGELPHNCVEHIFIDPKGKVWVTTLSNILVFIKDGKAGKETLTAERGISSLESITGENDSTIWVGSNGNGVFRIKPGSLTNITTTEDLFSDYCYSLVVDDNKNVWIGHRGGLSKIRAADAFVKPIQKSAGINSSCEFNPNAVFKDENNKIWFGTSEGLLEYNPATENLKVPPPVINITSCKVNDEEVNFGDGLTLSPGNYKIRIDFLCISLREPNLVNYVYQLEGYDISPVNTKTSSVIFPHLTDGEYTFHLWAITGDGIMSKTPLTINIVINKPLWKQGSFIIGSLLLLFFGILFYIRRRDMKYQAEKRILEMKVQERTLEITNKNTLLEEKQYEILTQNTELEKYRNYLEEIVDERTRELLIAKNKAEESDRLKSSFLHNISHEIRTPLNIISGFTTLLGDNDVEQEEKQNYIKTINNNTESLIHILNEILDVSKIEAGQFVLTKTKFNADEVIRDLENHYRSKNSKRIGIEFVNSGQPEGLELYHDKERFRQIFNNLLSNAFKFTVKGSIKFGYTRTGNSVRFFVSDSGIGIDKSEVDKIFTPFYKIEDNPDILYGGAGIGLTSSKRLVELMGGAISVESVDNEGSVFYFTLPVNTEHPVSKTKEGLKVFKKGFLKHKTILVETDEQHTFELVNKTLTGSGAKIVQVFSGQEIIDFIENDPLNQNCIILLDIKMPYSESYKINHHIKSLTGTVPVIALTAFTQSSEIQKISDEDFDGYLSKPIKAETLLNVLFHLFDIS